MLFLAVRDLSKGDAACEEYGMLHGFDNIAMGWEGLGGAFWGMFMAGGFYTDESAVGFDVAVYAGQLARR